VLGFVQGELPGEGVELLAAGAGWVRLELAGRDRASCQAKICGDSL